MRRTTSGRHADHKVQKVSASTRVILRANRPTVLYQVRKPPLLTLAGQPVSRFNLPAHGFPLFTIQPFWLLETISIQGKPSSPVHLTSRGILSFSAKYPVALICILRNLLSEADPKDPLDRNTGLSALTHSLSVHPIAPLTLAAVQFGHPVSAVAYSPIGSNYADEVPSFSIAAKHPPVVSAVVGKAGWLVKFAVCHCSLRCLVLRLNNIHARLPNHRTGWPCCMTLSQSHVWFASCFL